MRFLNLRFQTKLMLAVVGAIVFVSSWVIGFAEKKLKDNWTQSVEGQVAEEVEQYYALRKIRMEGSIRALERLGKIPILNDAYAKGSFDRKKVEEIRKSVQEFVADGAVPDMKNRERGRPGGGGPGGPGPGLGNGLNKDNMLICAVSPEGKVHPVFGGNLKNPSFKNALTALREIGDFESKHVGYLAVDFEASEERELIEVAVSPFMDSENEYAGSLLLGQTVAARQPQKSKRPSHPKSLNGLINPDMVTAIFVDGEIFGDGPVIDGTREDLLATVSKRIQDCGGNGESELFVTHEGEPFRVFAEELNPDSALPASYQVVLYPMGPLAQELKQLRLQGSGIGMFALLFGLLFAWFTSRSFAKPIRQLAVATEDIRNGNFETRVDIRSKDELGELGNSFNHMAEDLALKEQLRDALGKVSDETVAQALIEGRLELGGEIREVSILFCDIRGFTSLTEHMPPDRLIEFLNQHMTAMTRLVHKHKGVVDKFVGDEIMAVFGAPKAYGDDAANASRCALAMIEERRLLNESCDVPCDIGIGVATGEVIVGCMGSIDRLNYTVLGERVNRGARLCSEAEIGQVLVDEKTIEDAGDQLDYQKLTEVTPKGYSEPIQVFEVNGEKVRVAEKSAVEAEV